MKVSMPAILAASNRLVYPAIVLAAAAIATLPLLINGPSCGHDSGFHLTSWFEALESWRHGIVYPHWATNPNLGSGEPRFVFYPPISWMMGAALGAILPWHVVPAVLTFLMLASCGFATRALGRSLLSEPQAALAGCLAIFSGYAPYCAYARTAFGELLGGCWIPVILLLVLRNRREEGNVWQRALDGSAAPLALAIAGAWLSNGPAGVIASYLLVAVAALAAVLERSWAKLIRAIIAFAFGVALAGFYLIPVAQERSWVEMHSATDQPWTRIENNFIFAYNNFAYNPDPMIAEHDRVNHLVSAIGVSMFTLAAGAFFMAWIRNRLPRREQWIPLAAIPLAVLFLQFSISQPVWDVLPLLRMLQFPWRWLLTLEAPMAILLTLAIWPDRAIRKKRQRKRAAKAGLGYWQQTGAVIVCGVLFLAQIVITFISFPTCEVGTNFADILNVFASGSGIVGQLEYVPTGADNQLVAWGLPGACLTSRPLAPLGVAMHSPDGRLQVQMWMRQQGSCEATYAMEQGPAHEGMEHFQVKALLWHPGYLILRLQRYPAWRVTVNGQTVENMPEREDGLMAVPAPKGAVNVDVDWTTTPDVAAGQWLSVAALLVLPAVWWMERRRISGGVTAAIRPYPVLTKS